LKDVNSVTNCHFIIKKIISINLILNHNPLIIKQMENLGYYKYEQKCPFHLQHKDSSGNNDSRENANTGDWDDERDDTGTDPNRYNKDKFEEGGNDNSGGAGSSGSAATNS
jgi:hypothetical protein